MASSSSEAGSMPRTSIPRNLRAFFFSNHPKNDEMHDAAEASEAAAPSYASYASSSAADDEPTVAGAGIVPVDRQESRTAIIANKADPRPPRSPRE